MAKSQATLLDMLALTLPWLDKQFTETQQYTEYTLINTFFGPNGRAAKRLDGGTSYKRQVRARTGGTFKFVEFYEVNPPRREDVNVTLETPLVHWEEKAVWDEKEVDMNSGAARIIDFVEEQMSGKWEAIHDNIEYGLARAPVSATHTKSFRGIFYWIRTLELNVEDPIGGFNGKTIYFQDGSSTTTIAGQDAALAENERLRNWAATDSGVFDAQTVRLIRKGLTRTSFMALPNMNGDKSTMSGPKVLLAGHDRVDQAEDLVQKGPDDIGEDLARSRGPRVRGAPLLRVPVFDDIPWSPIVGVKKGVVRGLVLRDRWMRRRPARRHPDAEDTVSVTIQGSGNLTCLDLRAGGFVIHAKRTAA